MGFVFDTRSPHPSFVESIWHTSAPRAGSFTSVAATNWEIVLMTLNGETSIVARGPETRASEADYPAGAEFLGITFRLGTFMPHQPVRALRDRQDAVLPLASRTSFWLDGSAWEIPTFDNADVFVERLIRQGILVRDPVVEAALRGHIPDLSRRSLQHRFLQATGLSHRTIQQIERARRAVALLERGPSIADTTFELEFFDQAHLTNVLRRLMGKTPAQIARSRAVA